MNCTDGLDNDGDGQRDCADLADCTGVTCRASQGDCDVAEVCTGGVCPANALTGAGTVCRPIDGGCDVAEVCDGGSPACPDQGFAQANTVCRSAQPVCDVAETCPGNSPICPMDRFQLVGTACGATCMQICDNMGNCGGSGGTCPNGFSCGGMGMCNTSCTSGAQCQPNHVCSMNQCVRIAENNCLDGIDNNGDGLADCQDPSCVGSQVQCVPSVGAGASVGVLLDTGPCPPGYTTVQDRFQNLMPGGCVGCTCATACSVTVYAYSNSTCSIGQVSQTFTTTSTSYDCRAVASATRQGGTRSAFGKVCQRSGSSSQVPPTWGISDVFCVAQTSPTCAAGFTCVPVPPSPNKACVDVDSASSCPSGYSGMMSIYFTGFAAGSCGSCASASCSSASSLTCNAFSTVGQACGGAATLVDNSGCAFIDSSRNPVAGIANQFTRSGADNCTITPSNTPPSPTGGRRVCCLP